MYLKNTQIYFWYRDNVGKTVLFIKIDRSRIIAADVLLHGLVSSILSPREETGNVFIYVSPLPTRGACQFQNIQY